MDVSGLVSRVEQLIRLEKFALARQVIAEGLQLDADNRDLLLYTAEVEFLTENHARAAELTDRLVGRFPDWCRPFYLRARLLAERPDVEGAVAAMREAISLFPYEPEYHARLGQYLLLQHKYSESLAATDRALATDPAQVLALLVRSRALYALSRKDEADATYRLALAAEPDNGYSHLNYGKHLGGVGEFERAADHLMSALRLLPTASGLPESLIDAFKKEFVAYRKYQAVLGWYSYYRRGIGVTTVVLFTVICYALLLLFPYPASLPHLFFTGAVFWSAAALLPLTDVLANWVLYTPERRGLLGERDWLRTRLVTLLYAVLIAAAVSYAVTGASFWLVAFVYSATLLLPVYLTTEYEYGFRELRKLLSVLAIIALAGLAATLLGTVPVIFHLAYFTAFIYLLKVFLRQQEEN